MAVSLLVQAAARERELAAAAAEVVVEEAVTELAVVGAAEVGSFAPPTSKSAGSTEHASFMGV